MVRNPKKPIRYEIPGQSETAEALRVAFILKVPTLADRIAIDRAVAAAGGSRVGPMDVLIFAERELARVVEGEASAAAVAACRAVREMFEALAKRFAGRELGSITTEETASILEMHDALQGQLAELQPVFDMLAANSPAFARLRGDAAVYPTIRRMELLRILVLGHENAGLTLTRTANGLTDEALEALVNSPHAGVIAAELERLISPDGAARKN